MSSSRTRDIPDGGSAFIEGWGGDITTEGHGG